MPEFLQEDGSPSLSCARFPGCNRTPFLRTGIIPSFFVNSVNETTVLCPGKARGRVGMVTTSPGCHEAMR